MEKIQLEKKDNQDVIIVNAALVARVCDAMYQLEPALFAVEKCTPEHAEAFKKDVCNLIKEMHDAFLEG
jgi:hypothetical protein